MGKIGEAVESATTGIKSVKDGIASKIKVDPEAVIRKAIKLPGVRINREEYLKKELSPRYSEEVVQLAVEKNPAYAGISRENIDEIAKGVVNYETNKVSAISFATGLPGGAVGTSLVAVDLTQYFGFMLRAMQKVAYLYGFEDMGLDAEKITDETMNQLMLFLGVMFGVQGASKAVQKLAASTAIRASKSLASKALTKGTIYPIVKSVAKFLGQRMTKQIFANGVSKAVPVLGGIVTGGISYVTFKPCLKKLTTTFRKLPLSDPETYKDADAVIDVDYVDVMDDETDNSEE